MMLWFLLRDEYRIDGWQSGLLTSTGKRKPAFEAFRRMPRLAEPFVLDPEEYGYSSLPLAFPGI